MYRGELNPNNMFKIIATFKKKQKKTLKTQIRRLILKEY